MNERKKYELIINGLNVEAYYLSEDIDNIFIPFLQKLTLLQKEKGRRIIVFFAAAPGTGKTTLISFLELLSKTTDGLTEIQSIGLDGFHYSNHYLKTHHIDSDLNKPLLRSIKGKPQTFNTNKLAKLLTKLKKENVIWPIYSRKIHDVINEGPLVDKDIILLEGNYLLLNQAPWDKLIKHADYTVFIDADSEQLRKTTIERKVLGGASRQEAIDHYDAVDGPNIELVKTHSITPDLALHFDVEKGYKVK